MQNNISPMNAAELFDKVIDVYKKSFSKQVAYTAIVFSIGIVLLFLLVISVEVLAWLYVFALYSFACAGYMLISQTAFLGNAVRFRDFKIFGVFFRVATAFFAQIIVYIAVFSVIIFPTAFAAVVLGMLPENFSQDSVEMMIAGWVIFFVASLIFSAFSNIFALAAAVAAFEKRYFFGAVFRSWQLVKGQFWRVLGIRIIWGISIYAFFVCGVSILAFVGAILDYFEVNNIIFPIIFFFGMAFLFLVAAPLGAIMQTIIYFNRRMKTDGFDIKHNLKQLAEERA
jgi:hypothetical protein